MKSCAICSSSLSFLIVPPLDSGKLNDGNELCTRCYSKTGATRVNEYSLADIQHLLQSQVTDPMDKKLQAEEKKTAEENEKKINTVN